MINQISHFKILEELGRGGMGIVYKALDVRLQRYVALKILPTHLVKNENYLQRFKQEARAASALNHPNICTIYDVGISDDIHYIVMEYVDGETLRQILEREKFLPEKEVVEIAIQICEAFLIRYVLSTT